MTSEEELSLVKVVGMAFTGLGVLILIINAVLMLTNTEKITVKITGPLLLFGASLFFIGQIISHLPQEERTPF